MKKQYRRNEMSLKRLPEVGRPVSANVEHCTGGFKATVELIAVNESDVTWRFVDDNSELSYDWDVIRWKYTE